VRSSRGVWMVFGVLGAALWLSSLRIQSHPGPAGVAMLGVIAWSGYVMWLPKRH
jgi:hypothetical protein